MHTVAHQAPYRRARPSGFWHTLVGALRRDGPPKLDPETLPDYLKRDLGLLNGRDMPRRDLLRD